MRYMKEKCSLPSVFHCYLDSPHKHRKTTITTPIKLKNRHNRTTRQGRELQAICGQDCNRLSTD